MSWPSVIPQLHAEAEQLATYEDLLSRAESLLGRPVTRDSLDGAWRRHRHPDWPKTPQAALGASFDPWEGEATVQEEPRSRRITETNYDRPQHEPPRPNEWIEPGRLVLIPGDVHFPIHSPECLDAMTDFADDIGVDHLILQGDTFDNAGPSRHAPEAHRDTQLISELRSAADYLARWKRMFSRVDVVMGNHDGGRLERFINENPWMYQHPNFDPRSVFQIPERWHVHEWGSRVRMKDARGSTVCVEHGDKLKGVGRQYSAAAALRNNPFQTTIYGHTHRIDSARRTVYGADGLPVTFGAYSCGHLTRLSQHGYANEPTWQDGFVLLEFHSSGHTVHQVEMQRGRFSFGGKVYG